MEIKPHTLSVGPLLFNWPDEQIKNFYTAVAEDENINRVYLGEVVCAKRFSKRRALFERILNQLQVSKKEVFLSTPCLVVDPRDLELLDYITGFNDRVTIEANDLTSVGALAGSAFALGPYINMYSEKTLSCFIQDGACSITLPFEMGFDIIRKLTPTIDIEFGCHVFGPTPLAISSRCYHARAYGKRKDTCGIVCGKDPEGLCVTTMDGKEFLTINGLQTLSVTTANLVQEIPLLQKEGITNFIISPQQESMSPISTIFRSVIDHKMEEEKGAKELQALFPEKVFANGYFYQTAGHIFNQGAT